MQRRIIFMLALALTYSCMAESVDEIKVQAEYQTWSNLNRAALASDILADQSFDFGAALSRSWIMENDDSVRASLSATQSDFRVYQGANHDDIAAGLSWHHKFGLGRDVPWISLAEKYLVSRANEDIRNFDRADFAVSAGKRVAGTFDLYSSIDFESNRSIANEPVNPKYSGELYAGHAQTFTIGVDEGLDEHWLINAFVSQRRGDLVSTSPRNKAIYRISKAIAEDDTFGDEIYGYRIDATVNSIGLGLDYALDDDTHISLHIVNEHTDAAMGFTYNNHGVRLGISHEF